jgi:hypothetical protein
MFNYLTGKPRCAEQGFNARAIVFNNGFIVHSAIGLDSEEKFWWAAGAGSRLHPLAGAPDKEKPLTFIPSGAQICDGRRFSKPPGSRFSTVLP